MLTQKKKVNEKQYKTIKAYFIGSIATSVTLMGIVLGTYISTNQRIDCLYQHNQKILEELYEMRVQSQQESYRLNNIEDKLKIIQSK